MSSPAMVGDIWRRECSVCGDTEPFHVHNGSRANSRIEDYFTVGRGMTDFEAALEWKRRYHEVTGALVAAATHNPCHCPAPLRGGPE